MKTFLMMAAAMTSAALVMPTVAEARESGAYAESSARVSYADLDLSTREGQSRLDRRINAALRTVCGDPLNRDTRRAGHARSCIAAGKAKANTQVQLAAKQAKDGKRAA